MTREEAIKESMKEKDVQLLKILSSAREGIGSQDIKDAAKQELIRRGVK